MPYGFASTQAPPAGGSELPVGIVLDFCGDVVPDGWLECNGDILDIELYPALAALVGNRFRSGGGDEPRVPDLRARVTVGIGPADGFGEYETWAYAVGEIGGAVRGDTRLERHNHGGVPENISVDAPAESDASTDGGGDRVKSVSLSYENTGYTADAGDESLGGKADSRQPYMILRKIIKAA